MTIAQFNIYAGLTPARLVSTANIAGTYFNGTTNNGVGATLTIAASSLTIDSVLCVVGDRVLLHTQTNTYEQGLYIVLSIGSTVVLQRSADMQSIEQILAGQFVSIAAGTLNAGNFYSIVEPLPARLGIDGFVWNADPGAGSVSFSGAASTIGALPVFSDTAGNLKVPTTTVTVAQALSVTGAITASGAITSTAGNVTSGSLGDAGTFISFPATTGRGTLILAAVNNTGNDNVTLSNAAHGQASVYSIPDSGASTANLILSKTTGTQNITVGGLQVDAGVITSGITSGGQVGAFRAYATTASNGYLALSAIAAGGAFNTTISNTTMGQSSVITIPDPGAATSTFVLQNGTNTAATFTTLNAVNLKFGATPVAQTDIASSTITAAAGASNVSTVTIQLKDGSGANMARILPFKVYSSSTSDGLTLQSAASTGYSVASGGLSLANGTAVTTQISCMSSATGGCVLSLTDTAKLTSYLVLVMDSGAKISAQLSAGSYGA